MIDQQITIPQAEYEALQHYKRVYGEVSQILACIAECEPAKDGDEITVQRLKWVVREYPELAAAPEAPAQADPCPGCKVGAVCRTPKCGRLKLPVDHPLRTGAPAQAVSEREAFSWEDFDDSLTADALRAVGVKQPTLAQVTAHQKAMFAALTQQPASQTIPAPWVEAVKVAREALLHVRDCTYVNDSGRIALSNLYSDEHVDAAIAQLDALTKEQP